MSKPYIPVPFRPGNAIVREYEEEYDDRILHRIDYRNRKGQLKEGFVMRVEWKKLARYYDGKN